MAIEKIGKITIDNTCYPGEDLYCDGAVEDEILEIVKSRPASEYGKVIEEKAEWPVLYHLSSLRENIVNWIPIEPGAKVLEVGSGCGAITGALAEKAESVTCVELSKKRSLINAYRHLECENVTIRLGNFQELEPELDRDYDYIFLIGVFEYAQSYIGGEKPFETFLAILHKHLAGRGRMIIAIENRFGLKYWAGCMEDHLGAYFEGIEGYPRGGGVRTFTRRGLEAVCRANGLSEYSFYYPYPDYKFMTTLYSDKRLPKKGELSDNMRNFDRERLLLFDEKQVFDSLLEEGLFPQFSNSYVLVIGKPLPVVYARFSNDRADEYAICTEIWETKEGTGEETGKESGRESGKETGRESGQPGGRPQRKVYKRPLTKAAAAHVAKLEESYRRLSAASGETGLAINRCRLENGRAALEYLDGPTLEELLDGCLERGDEAGFRELFDEYRRRVEDTLQGDWHAFDLIFGNLILTGDVWNLIDYEWVYPGKGSAEELIVRALYCYGLGSEKRKKLSLDLIKKEYGYEESRLQSLIQKENEFQKMSTGGRMAMTDIRNAIGRPIVPAAALMHDYIEAGQRNRIQIYEDYGNGFSEETSYFLPKGYEEKEPVRIKLTLRAGLRAVRIDPCLDACMVQVRSLTIGGKPVSLREKIVKLNGNLIYDDLILFPSADPNITLLLPGPLRDETEIDGVFEILRISGKMAESGEKSRKNASGRKGFLWFGK